MASVRLRPTIVLFGDSLTEQAFGVDGAVGWASLLANAYMRRADVLNRGFSGYNTRHALEVLPRVFPTTSEEDPLFFTVLLGANDAALPGERQHVPVAEFEDNLGKIVASLRQRMVGSDVPIILLTPPPIDKPAWDSYCPGGPNSRTNEAARNYGNAVKQVAAQMDCPVLDVFELLGGDKGEDSYGKHLSDGLHLSSSGNTLLYEGLMKLIKETFPHLAPMEDGDGRYGTSGIPMEEKLWSDLC